ncbi:MAG: hypothetical protein GAK45_00172 [Pseudomonas citronellolis]|nr:MAG: hypothetical protein GAK45_00172 [Pseudomonas citronellolis]
MQQVAEVRAEALDGRGVEQVAGVHQLRAHPAVAALFGVQGEVELGDAAGQFQALQGQRATIGAGQLAQVVAAARLVVAGGLEQRVVAEAALGLQGLDQLFEGQVRVRLGTEHGLAGAQQEGLERLLRVDLGAEHLGVDEEADQPLALGAIAPGDGHADAQFALAAVARQQHLVGRQQEHEQGRAVTPGQFAQALDQRPRQVEIDGRAAIALHRRAWAVGGQAEQQRLADQLRGPVVELALAFAGRQPQALPARMVAVLDRQCRQVRRHAAGFGAVEAGEFVDQHAHRPAIGDGVVQVEQQQVALCAQARQVHPQQRPGGQVEGPLGAGGQPVARLGFIGEVRALQVGRAGGQDALPHLAVRRLRRGGGVRGAEDGAQAFVALDQRGEGALQGGLVQAPAQTHGGGDVVGGAVRFHLPEEPQPRLRRRQRGALAAFTQDRQARQAHALLAQLAQEGHLAFLGQRPQAFGNLPQLGVHRFSHDRFSSSPSSSSINSSSSCALAAAPRWVSIQAARAWIELSSNSRCSGSSRPRR